MKEEAKRRYGMVNFERREHPRFSVDLPAEYCQINSLISGNGRTINASESGLMLYLPEQPEIDQYLRIKLFFTSEGNVDNIEGLAQVVWLDIHFGETGDYRCGVRFVDLSSENVNKLRNFLESLSGLEVPSLGKEDEKP